MFPGLKSLLLEKRVEVLSEALEMKDAQLGEVLAAAHLDPATLQQVILGVQQRCIQRGCIVALLAAPAKHLSSPAGGDCRGFRTRQLQGRWSCWA
ncbi:hypothetical protein COO60DRAFT_1228612 [Scenedesmus sp. NREL 46B-D3]|nr:hypothetical protein COO60DRAFT_1228612 [Scenedesmus sp. NREL 46B-D3]